ncbi:MAG: hypothetical protein A3B31_03615 [Candidatus Komeilibacteria bacterium RIFCSPLOWO2_01_FULL_53_11]|uniref:Uncharacterized protein n=1 Tax=Candidatus Komeilibacteria bacterium RIFCSPLOWO2_01_FULL_53_11 TaxID=1798552 RepID=A0A1G2BXM5_9BACT|nr:MAG: hypothetical protein A3B31_03615 [Candidatus Komeilibacteria bacterium RIFCSPLOWO2_01_FULL_53_11]
MDTIDENKHADEALEQTLVSEDSEPALASEVVGESASASIDDPYHLAEHHLSWTFFTLIVTAVLIGTHIALAQVGVTYFWPPRVSYVVSILGRAIMLFLLLFVFRGTYLTANPETRYVASAWIAFIAGAVTAFMRFVHEPMLWTFLNLLIEPLDGVLLALIAAYFVYAITKQKTLNPEIP